MSDMLSNCQRVASLDLSKFNAENVIEMEELFLNCENLENIIFDEKFILNKVEDISYMFVNREKLKEIEMGIGSKNMLENLKSFQNICYRCTSVKKIYFNIDNNNSNTFEKIRFEFCFCW